MRTRLTWAGRLPAIVSLVAVAVMGVASFLPYLQTPWPGTYVGVSPAGVPLGPLPTASLLQWPDASLVFEILVVLGLAAAIQLIGRGRRVTALASFGASLTLAFAGIYPAMGVGAPIAYGLYLFVAAALTATVAGLVMVVVCFRGTRLAMATALPAVISLIAVGVMGGASFLPFVQYPWTDGIFSFPSAGGLPSGPGPTSSISGYYTFYLLDTLVVLALAAAAHLVGFRPRTTGIVCLGASVAAVAFACRYVATQGAPVLMEYGFYLFVAAAVVAAVAALVMVGMTFRGARRGAPVALHPTAP